MVNIIGFLIHWAFMRASRINKNNFQSISIFKNYAGSQGAAQWQDIYLPINHYSLYIISDTNMVSLLFIHLRNKNSHLLPITKLPLLAWPAAPLWWLSADEADVAAVAGQQQQAVQRQHRHARQHALQTLRSEIVFIYVLLVIIYFIYWHTWHTFIV